MCWAPWNVSAPSVDFRKSPHDAGHMNGMNDKTGADDTDA